MEEKFPGTRLGLERQTLIGNTPAHEKDSVVWQKMQLCVVGIWFGDLPVAVMPL